MIFLRRLVQLSVLLIHAGWWGVAPSPTDEGALRTGHGEHGEPGHQEPHKDSYSTFASEFLESRYLSDDGEDVTQSTKDEQLVVLFACFFFPHTSTRGLAWAGQRLICASVVLHPTCHLNMRPFSTQASSPMVAAHPFLLLTHTQSADGLSSVGLHH